MDHYPSGVSPYGVMDMSGNVWEWYLNEYANPDDSNVAGEATRALRGGSWFTSPSLVSASARNRFEDTYRSNSVGFRLVREIP